jgi:hypothetical protein
MSFLSPLFLIAISAVGLPLIIHLLNLRRPQKVQFSTLAFFKELQKTTIRKIRVKRYLLLLLRLLAISCLALVLARPFLPPGLGSGTSSQAPSLNAILIDNSISMGRIGEQGPLIEQARQIVESIEQSSKDSDRFILQVTNGEAQYTTIIGHSQLLNRIGELEISSSGNYTANRMLSLKQILKDAPYENKRIFVVSDGQASQFSGDMDWEEDRTITTTLIDLENVEVQNTAITGIESSTNMIGVGLPVNISVNVQNKSEVPVANQFVSIEFGGQLVGQYSLSLESNVSQTFTFEVVPSEVGSNNGKVIIEGDEFTADNEYFFTIEVPETRRILWVREEQPATDMIDYTEVLLQASGENDAQLSYDESGIEILGTSEIGQYDAIILDGLATIPEFAFSNLLEYVQGGNGIVFFPSEEGNVPNYNDFFRLFNVGSISGILGEYASFRSIARVDELQEDHPIFTGLFERENEENLRVANPDVYYYLKLNPSSSPGGFNILSLNNDDPLIREKRFGDGRLIISAIGNTPGWSDFAVKSLYAPFYYRAMLYSASSDEGGFVLHELGDVFTWTGDIDMESVEIGVGDETVIPEARVTATGVEVTFPGEDWTPGWVTVSDEDEVHSVAVNLNRTESSFTTISEDEMEEKIEGISYVDASGIGGEDLQSEIRASGFGKEIWSWFMLAGLIFLITESLVSVFYKAETIT